MFIPGCLCCGKTECMPVMSPCLGPYSLNFKFSETFTAGANLTSEQAALLNSVLAYPVCFPRLRGEGGYGGQDAAGNDAWSIVPGTFTINGAECRVGAYGMAVFGSSFNCGWAIGGPPTPFIEWSYWLASNTDYGGDYLMSWDNGANNGGWFQGPEDAQCVLESGGTVSSQANGALLNGSGDNGDTYGSTYSTVTLSTGSCGGVAGTNPFRSPNATWTSLAFSGRADAFGSSAYPNFSKASATIAGYTGYRPSITANRAGVIHITADNVSYDYWWRVYRGSTKVIEYGSASTPDEGGNTGSITDTFSVSAGDVITLGDPSDYNVATNLSIWWTAT